MSRLRLRTKGFQELTLNVVSFMTPIFAATSSSQTQSSEQHHPVRCQQPNIRFDVIFRNEREFEAYQTFIRTIQIKLLRGKDPNDVAVVTLWWPERNINNWQGLIKSADGGGQRYNWTPQTVIEVEIIKGMVAQQASLFSFGTEFDAIFGGDRNTLPSADSLLSTPAPVAPFIGNGAVPNVNNVGAPNSPLIGSAGSLSSLTPAAGTVDSLTIGGLR